MVAGVEAGEEGQMAGDGGGETAGVGAGMVGCVAADGVGTGGGGGGGEGDVAACKFKVSSGVTRVWCRLDARRVRRLGRWGGVRGG